MLATGVARSVESRLVTPALAKLTSAQMARDHVVSTNATGHFWDLPPAGKLWLAGTPSKKTANAYIPDGTQTWAAGLSLVAVCKESIRRIPQEHGIFLWTIQYRLAEDGKLRARPVVVFHMAFDRAIHRFENRFRPDEPDTAVSELTAEMIRTSVLDAFQFYDMHADSDEDPFQRGS